MKRFFLCLLALLCLALLTGQAGADSYGNYEYTITGGEASITAYMLVNVETDVVIPTTLGGAPVTRIGRGAFQGNTNIRTVVIPDSVTTMDGMVFSGCSALREVTLSSGLTRIPIGCFQQCASLTSVVIPASVTGISMNAFTGCTSLERIYLPDSAVSISSNALPAGVMIVCHASSPNAEAAAEFIDPVIPDWVLAWRAVGSSLQLSRYEGLSTRPVIPAAASGIPINGMRPEALLDKNLDTLYLPESLTSIGDEALLETSAARVVIPASCRHIGDHAFAENAYLIYVVLPAGLSDISDDAFDGCPNAILVTQTADSFIEAFAQDNGLEYLDLSSLAD